MDDPDTKLMAYVDGELDAAAVQEVERALERDPAARAKVERFRETRTLLRAACAEGLYDAPLDRLRPLLTRAAQPGRRRLAAAVVAACVGAGLVGFGGAKMLFLGGSARDAMLNEVAEYHEVYSRETDHLAEVPAERAAELRAWLGARLGRKLDLPDLTQAGLHLAGGRLLVIDGKPVAELMYTRAFGPPVALCVTAMGGHDAEPLRVDTRGDLRLASWTDGRHVFVIVGELDQVLARRIAGLAETQLNG